MYSILLSRTGLLFDLKDWVRKCNKISEGKQAFSIKTCNCLWKSCIALILRKELGEAFKWRQLGDKRRVSSYPWRYSQVRQSALGKLRTSTMTVSRSDATSNFTTWYAQFYCNSRLRANVYSEKLEYKLLSLKGKTTTTKKPSWSFQSLPPSRKKYTVMITGYPESPREQWEGSIIFSWHSNFGHNRSSLKEALRDCQTVTFSRILDDRGKA